MVKAVDPHVSLDLHELETSALFRGVKLQSVRGILEDCPVREVEGEEVLIEAGKPNNFLYVLLAGQLSVRLELKLDPIAILGPGEFVGELSLIDGQPTSADVVSEDKCRLLVIEEKTLWSLIDACPQVGSNLLFVLSQRLRYGNSLILTGQLLQREYRHFTVIDALTGLYNRSWLNRRLPEEMARSRKSEQDLSLLLIKIDDFENYANNHGHLARECALYSVARTIKAGMLSDELIVRYGEDEFIALLPDKDASANPELADRLRQGVAESKIVTENREVLPSVTISVGIAQMNAEDTPLTLISAADKALYDARNEG